MILPKVHKDNSSRLLFCFFEKKKKILKFLSLSFYVSLQKKLWFFLVMSLFPKKSSISLIRNRCIFTGRGRGVLSKFKVSRHVFKQFSNKGYICNLKKSS